MTPTETQRRFSKLAAAINQKAAKLGSPGRISAEDLAQTYLEDDRSCRYCGTEVSPKGVSFDHVIPFAKGGANTRSNLASSCITCQREKFTKTPEQHVQWRATTLQCAGCGKSFKPRFADHQRGYGKYCSRVCSGRAGGEAERTA